MFRLLPYYVKFQIETNVLKDVRYVQEISDTEFPQI